MNIIVTIGSNIVSENPQLLIRSNNATTIFECEMQRIHGLHPFPTGMMTKHNAILLRNYLDDILQREIDNHEKA